MDEKAVTAPVYDERGNVRPRGTPGTRPMTYAERVAIAKSLNEGPAQRDPVEKRATTRAK